MNVAFMTLGCKVNQYETRRLMKSFLGAGFGIVSFSDNADVYVVNTCTVTSMADRKSRKMLHRAKRLNENALVVAMGCFVTADKEAVLSDENIDIAISNDEKDDALLIILKALGVDASSYIENTGSEDSVDDDPCNEHTRAYIKVQDGCNQFCTYCKIPYVRGKLKSRAEDEVITEITELCKAGYKEVVITGIHLSSYGVDKAKSGSFIELKGRPLYELLKKVCEIPGLERVRLGSLEPRVITEEFAKNIASLEKVCPHFHLSLQSGCDETLKRMNRKYTTAEYKEAADILKKYYEKPSLTTDVIVGFPGEDDEEFNKTLDFVKEIHFSMIHVFKYSRRAGTYADKLPDQVDENIKNIRSAEMISCAEEMTKEYAESFIGNETDILIEEIITLDDEPYYVGHNERYMRFVVPCDRFNEDMINRIVRIKAKQYIGDDLLKGE